MKTIFLSKLMEQLELFITMYKHEENVDINNIPVIAIDEELDAYTIESIDNQYSGKNMQLYVYIKSKTPWKVYPNDKPTENKCYIVIRGDRIFKAKYIWDYNSEYPCMSSGWSWNSKCVPTGKTPLYIKDGDTFILVPEYYEENNENIT
jgi:hypothetical protein